MPLGSPSRRPMRFWALGAIVVLLGGGGWLALGPTASADTGVETRRGRTRRFHRRAADPWRGPRPPHGADRGAARCRRAADRLPGAERRRGEGRRRRHPLRHVDRRTPARREALRAARGRGGDPARARRQHDQRPGDAQRRDQAPLRRRAREARRLDQRSDLTARRREGGHLARRRRTARTRSGDEGHRQRGDVAGGDGSAGTPPREGARRRAPRGDAAGGPDPQGAGRRRRHARPELARGRAVRAT